MEGQEPKSSGYPEGDEPKFWGHPVGLYVCAVTELWERFSFYGMKFLLLFYLTKYHLFSDEHGLDVLGGYATLVYAMPVIGGILADRYLGMRKAVLFGGILLCLGHLGMAFEGSQAYINEAGVVVQDSTAIQVFYFSLALIIMGVGFLKPNISTIVGRLYKENDPARDAGFTIFYMGINLGSFVATILCGYLGETYGWKYGFGLAGIGMIVGLIIFSWGQKFLYGHAEPANPAILKDKIFAGLDREKVIYLGALFGVVAAWQMVQYHSVVTGVLLLTVGVLVVGLIWFILSQCTPVERDRMIVLMVLTVFSVIFWALFEQSAASMNLFADRVLNRTVFGVTFTASQLGSLNAMFIFLLAPFFAMLWVFLGKKKWEPNTAVKFGLGIIQAGLGFGALVIGASMPGESGKVAIIWFVLAYLLHTTGELCLSPVGLSAVTKLAVPRVVGVMMGAWFLATAASEYVAALISKVAAMETVGGEVEDVAAALTIYSDLFSMLLWVGIGTGLFLILLSPFLKKLTHGVH